MFPRPRGAEDESSSPVPARGCWFLPGSFLPLTLAPQSQKAPSCPLQHALHPPLAPAPDPPPRSALAELERQSRGLAGLLRPPPPCLTGLVWCCGILCPGCRGAQGHGVPGTHLCRELASRGLYPDATWMGLQEAAFGGARVPFFFCPPSPLGHMLAPVEAEPDASWGGLCKPGVPSLLPPGAAESPACPRHAQKGDGEVT